MKLPLWIWDHKLNRYVNIPPGTLRTYPDGKIGTGVGQTIGSEAVRFYQEHRHLFTTDYAYTPPGGTPRIGLLSFIPARYILKEPKRKNKQPWYAKQHIRRYQSE